jgi:hypothetical protein
MSRRTFGQRLRRSRLDLGAGRLRTVVAAPVAIAIPLARRGSLVTGHPVDVVLFFEKIRHVQKRVALQTQIDKRRLHSGEHPRHPAFVNAAGQ